MRCTKAGPFSRIWSIHDFRPGDGAGARGEGAIAKNRELMGATDPKKADKGTIRADFADSIDANAVHGSDAVTRPRWKSPIFSPH